MPVGLERDERTVLGPRRFRRRWPLALGSEMVYPGVGAVGMEDAFHTAARDMVGVEGNLI